MFVSTIWFHVSKVEVSIQKQKLDFRLEAITMMMMMMTVLFSYQTSKYTFFESKHFIKQIASKP